MNRFNQIICHILTAFLSLLCGTSHIQCIEQRIDTIMKNGLQYDKAYAQAIQCLKQSLEMSTTDPEVFRKDMLQHEKSCARAMKCLTQGIRFEKELKSIIGYLVSQELTALKLLTPSDNTTLAKQVAKKYLQALAANDDIALRLTISLENISPADIARNEKNLIRTSEFLLRSPYFTKSALYIRALPALRNNLEQLQEMIAQALLKPFMLTQGQLYRLQFKQLPYKKYYYFNMDPQISHEKVKVVLTQKMRSTRSTFLADRVRIPPKHTSHHATFSHTIEMAPFDTHAFTQILWSTTDTFPLIKFILLHEWSHTTQMHSSLPRFTPIEIDHKLDAYYKECTYKDHEYAADYAAASTSKETAYAAMVFFGLELLYTCVIAILQHINTDVSFEEIIQKTPDLVEDLVQHTPPEHPNSFERFLRCSQKFSYVKCREALNHARDILQNSEKQLLIGRLRAVNQEMFHQILISLCNCIKDKIPLQRDRRDFMPFACTECPIL